MANHHQHGSSGTAVAVVATIFALLLGGILVLGIGSWFYFQTNARRAEEMARMQAERAFAAAEESRAQAVAAAERAEQFAKAKAVETATRELVISLDEEGNTVVDGEPVDLDGLKTLLQKAIEDETTALTVHLQVAPTCVFKHVAAAQSVCSELGIGNVRVGTLPGG